MVTIKEISELANTSRGTVDRVLHGRGNVNKELEERILKIAEEHQYQSNPIGRALAHSKNRKRIGVVINSKGNRFFDEVLKGIYETIDKYRSYGLRVVVKEIKGYKESEQIQAIDELLMDGISALALTPMNTPAIIKKLENLSIPIVTLNSDLHLRNKLAFIGCDYLNSGRLCGDLANLILPEGGRVGIVAGSFAMLGHRERIKGFEQAVEDHPSVEIVRRVENNDDDEQSYVVTKELLMRYRPDLIYFCAAGAAGGIEAIKEWNGETPVKIITVDEIEYVNQCLKDGTVAATVTQQPYQQGATMVEILYNYLIVGTKPQRVHNYMHNQVKLKNTK